MMALLTLAKGLLKSARFWGVIAAISALSGTAVWGYNKIYDAGYNAAELKWVNSQQEAIDKAVGRARENWELSAEVAGGTIKAETEIVERERIVVREVPKIVERVVPGECRDLGPDIQRLYNDAVRAANGNEGSGSDVAPAPSD